jgi:hypothetical protein
MSVVLKRYIPTIILAALAFFMVGDTLIAEPTYNSLATSGRSATTIISSFAVMLSITLLTRIHVRRIARRRTVIESSVLLICMWVTVLWGLFRLAVYGIKPAQDVMVQNIFNGIVSPGDSTIYSILAFFIASAAYRAFRTRSVEATILLAAGILVMLGKAPIGEMIWTGFMPVSDWIMNVANKAGSRVILMSAIIATIALYIRIILGYERGWMGRGD